MFLLAKPTDERIREFLSSQKDKPFSYADADIAAHQSRLSYPRGYVHDHNRIKLGEGADVFRQAVEALRRWEMFNIGWLHLCWPDAPIEIGTTVAVLADLRGFWSLNACRIARVFDEEGGVRRYGFAYGTLPEHVERGQESFIVEWNRIDDSVWYDLSAYSRPNQLLAKLGYPVTRALQKRFARDSMQAMVRGSAGP
jgi:uncharacterized protein (UPF0548 family)